MAYMEIDRFDGKLHFVKIAYSYHIVDYDEQKDEVSAVYSADARMREYLKAAGFTDKSIRSVTRGRTKKTALAMYHMIVRMRKRGYDQQNKIIGDAQ